LACGQFTRKDICGQKMDCSALRTCGFTSCAHEDVVAFLFLEALADLADRLPHLAAGPGSGLSGQSREPGEHGA
jgi:hypothetical protein